MKKIFVLLFLIMGILGFAFNVSAKEAKLPGFIHHKGLKIETFPELKPILTSEDSLNEGGRFNYLERTKNAVYALVSPGDKIEIGFIPNNQYEFRWSMCRSYSYKNITITRDMFRYELQMPGVIKDLRHKTKYVLEVPKDVDSYFIQFEFHKPEVKLSEKSFKITVFTNRAAADKYFMVRYGVKSPLEGSGGGFLDYETIKNVVEGVTAVVVAWWVGSHFIWGGAPPAPELPGAPPVPKLPRVPNNPYYKKDGEDLIYTDPATGAQSMYSPDKDGNWVNVETGGMLDLDRVDEVTAGREADRAWSDNQMKSLQNGENAHDKALKDIEKRHEEEIRNIDQQTKKDLYAIKTGQYGLDKEARQARLDKIAEESSKTFDKQMKKAAAWDKAVTVAEITKTVADISIDVLAALTEPVGGGLIADGYAMLSNIGGSAAEAYAGGRSVIGGITDGAVKGSVDVWQNHAKGKWAKLASYVGGESIKGGLEAAIKGENVLKGAWKGAKTGTGKLTIHGVSNVVGSFAKQTPVDSKIHYEIIRKNFSRSISEKSTDALIKMFAKNETLRQKTVTGVNAGLESIFKKMYL